ncbi:MAG TPA: FGGY-family carbohydrate kinase, partial [Pyrinomonadaceae bacterium]|nr:FGGY-family carbohydrate kinase [Pyrinomonadaceae bacterium]
VDENGRAATPVYGWAERRAAGAAETLRTRFDERLTHARTGCRFHASYWPAKILWLREQQPSLFEKVARWFSFSDLLSSRFFGEAKTSVSMASGTGLLDTHRCEWDEEILSLLGIGHENLPPLAEDKESFNLVDEYARRWPRLSTARWFQAVGDGAANNIGAGCNTRGRVSLMVGTSGDMRAVFEGDFSGSLPPALWCYRVDRERIAVGGASSDGGGLYEWMKESLKLRGDGAWLENELAAIEPDSHGLTVLPFWSGERSTGWNAHARGAILGMTQHTRPIEILRAAMEAVAYRLSLIARSLASFAPGAEIVASGGALNASTTWAQIIADVMGRPVHLSAVREASSRGAALLALEATGKLKSIREASAPILQTFEPDAARHELYKRALERHRKIYERIIADQEFAKLVSET